MSVTIPDAAPIPDTYTPVTVFGAAVINALAPFVTLHMAWYLDAIGVFVDPVYTLVMGQGMDDGVTPTVGTYVDGVLVTEGYEPGYGSALNPQTATVDQLAYLAQWVGVKIPAGADYATSLSLVTAESGLNRGTSAAVIAAAKRNLSGTQSVALVERTYVDGTPNAGWFLVVVRPEEIIELSALEAAISAVKFGGLMFTIVQSDAPLLSEYTRLFDAVTADLDAATLADVT